MEGYVITAALQHFGIASMESEDTPNIATTLKDYPSTRQAIFQSEMIKILRGLVNLPIKPNENSTQVHIDKQRMEYLIIHRN